MSTAAVLIGAAVIGAGASAAQALSKLKMPKAVPTPTVNQAAEEAQKRDVLSRRRTPAADMLMGVGGAESSTGAKTSLGA